jgi:Ca2+-binding RTX toxin-like protein
MPVQTTKDPVILQSGNGLVVTANEAYVGNDETTIRGIGVNHVVQVFGTVTSTLDAIWLGNDTAIAAHNKVEIESSGIVEGGTHEGVEFWGGSDTLTNAGEISSDEASAVTISSTAETGSSSIQNSNTITGAQFGIQIFPGTNDIVTVTNTGTIKGTSGSYAAISMSEGTNVDIINNKGMMIGAIYLGGNDDSYKGSSGTVKGLVSGGSGSDTLIGGAENNTFHGDDGFDFITGGRGADILTGGADADRFIYHAISDSTVAIKGRDEITDFNGKQFDLVDLHDIDANSRKSGNQRFDFIGDDAFSKTAGELHTEVKGGDTILSGDTNGDGQADFAIAFDGKVKLDDGDFIL